MVEMLTSRQTARRASAVAILLAVSGRSVTGLTTLKWHMSSMRARSRECDMVQVVQISDPLHGGQKPWRVIRPTADLRSKPLGSQGEFDFSFVIAQITKFDFSFVIVA